MAGLGAAWSLHPRHRVTLFEARDRLGGHAHTVEVESGAGPTDGEPRRLALDTGFLVFNRTTYPNLTRLLERLDVRTHATDMSFAVTCRSCGLEYGGRGLAGVLAQPTNALRPSFLRMLWDVGRFNRWGRRAVANGGGPRIGLGEFVDRRSFGDEFARHYLVPLAAALWSASPETARDYPMDALLEFMDNHRLLGVTDRLDWETVTGGSACYVEAMTRDFRDRVRVGTPVRAVERAPDGVRVRTDSGSGSFDRAVVATHADQALALLADPSPGEREALGAWRYSENDVWLHTDPRLLPDRPGARSSWNYRLIDCGSPRPRVTVSYHLNRLQGLDTSRDWVVSLNPERRPTPGSVRLRTGYRHPVFTREAVDARDDLPAGGRGRVHLCGAYFGNGFHEDALTSGLRVGASLGGRLP